MTEPTITPIQTKFDGRHFRSRTEARWAVFFKALSFPYEYEKEGFDLDGRWYLPDFWLPGFGRFLEVKGAEPTPQEILLCQRLSTASGKGVWLVSGQPQEMATQWWSFEPNGDAHEREVFLADRRNAGEFWLQTVDADGLPVVGRSIGPVDGPAHDRYPVVSDDLRAAYAAALSERFDA